MNERAPISLSWATRILLAFAAIIPLMWLTGHRANNSFILLSLVFLLLLRSSPDFYFRTHRFIAHLAHDAPAFRTVIGLLLVIAVVLAVLHFAFPSAKVSNLDDEGSAGTTFAGFLLAANAFLAWIARRHSPRLSHRRAWTVLSLLLALLALDELSEFHHGAARLAYWTFTGDSGKTILVEGLSFWIIVLSPVILAVISGLIWFARKILHAASRRLALAGLAAWVASQALEATIGSKILPHTLEIGFEEFLEMTGSTNFLGAFLRELAHLTYFDRLPTPSRIASTFRS